MALLNKLLVNSRSLVGRNVVPLKTSEGARRYKHVAAVPARNPMSLRELITVGILLGVSMYSLPYWVLYHIPDYQKEERPKRTRHM